MPEINDEDWMRIEAWRELPARERRVFSVVGPALSGKTAYLRAVHDRWPSAVLIDCRGMSADAVATRMRDECRAAPAGRPCGFLLANVQYAGEVLTSTEPARVAEVLAPGFRRFEGREVWVMAEYDSERVAPLPSGEYQVVLPAPPPAEAAAEEPEAARRLGALAAAELRQVPLSVWKLLCESSGTRETVSALLAFAEQQADVLAVDEVRSSVAFRSDALLHAWRRRQPWDSADQSRVVGALVSAVEDGGPGLWGRSGPVGQYAAHALPLHAALAGGLPRLLEDGRMLAQCTASAVREAIAVAYPDGVPYASVAAMLHYLEAQGITPSSQGEWVAWLHHAALSSGRRELAEQLLASGVPLPWRTTWTHWRPMGIFGQVPDQAGRVDELGVTSGESGLRVVTARDMTTGKNAHPKHRYVRQEWNPATGEPAIAPVHVRASLAEGGLPWYNARRLPGSDAPAAAFARHTDSGWQLDTDTIALPPRCPSAVTQGVHVDGSWVLAGTAGLFAVSVQAAEGSGQAAYRKQPLVAAHTRSAPWPLPRSASAALRGRGMRDWLEETFGPDTCHRLTENQLPPGLGDRDARSFLLETGLPEISDFLNLAITPRDDRPLPEVAWPGRGRDVPRQRRARSEAPSNGPFYELGTWMYSGLLLDGSTGRLFRDTTGGSPDPVAGSSLTQFFAMVRLYDEFRRTHFPYAPDHKDAQSSLTAWCRQIDGVAARAETWTLILEGYDFEDSTWDLASYGDEWV
ncbi:SUKH-4 family immunity protein [Streptomyces altiplanensis]